ncbi:hypothetical protein JK635_08315, partial [Neobacillus sp. YIM B02564]
MFHVNVSPEQISYVEHLIENVNFGRRGVFDGSKNQQRTGLIGQVVLSDLLGVERPKGGGFDGGVDFTIEGFTVDLKTMGRTVDFKPSYVHNFTGSQIHFDTDILLFASLNMRKNILTVCGYLPKDELKTKATFFKFKEKRFRDNGTYLLVRDPKGLYE